jgi:TolB-like protein/class 3 adenylate cyclase/tetratricopeptide (TPR) repeat protein
MAPRTERKLAAILAADVVGYSRLVGDDEAGTIARLRVLRKEFVEPLVADYRGRVVKLMGDGALVEFASAVDAVECAVAIQKGVAEREAAVPEDRRLAFRIGINVGDIIVEDDDILGDGVNVAARLEGLAEPGGICIARNVWNQVKGKLDLAFDPMGEHRVKNIAEPVTVYRVNLDAPGRALRRRPAWAQRSWQAAAAATLLILAGAAAGAWYALWPQRSAPSVVEAATRESLGEKPALPLPDKPSIAVLPFDNLSGEASYERLADGITEDIISDLSRFHDLFVIARNSTFVYKDKPTDIRQVARELGVQYVIEGSLQAENHRVRITAQLIDAATGNHVWSEQYERPLDDVFAIQDEVTSAIAASLPGFHGVLARARRELARRKPPIDLQAYDYYTLGIEHKHRFTETDNNKAKEFFHKALNLDPNFARAHIGLAWAHLLDIDFGWTKSRQQSMEHLINATRKAIALDPYDGEARMAFGIYYQYLNDFARAVEEIDQSVELNPSSADQLAQAAWVLTRAGEPERSLELMERAVRLNPHHPDWYGGAMRETYFHNSRFEETIAVSRTRLYPEPIWDPLYRVMSYAQLGRQEEAALEVKQVLVDQPDYSAEKWLNDTGTYARDVELNLFLDSNRKADLPICATEEQLAKYTDVMRLPECDAARARS